MWLAVRFGKPGPLLVLYPIVSLSSRSCANRVDSSLPEDPTGQGSQQLTKEPGS
jgi:hypothetical protein